MYLASVYYQDFRQGEAVSDTDKGLLIGHQRPEFSLPDSLGLVHSISEWDGKVILLNFWASWCVPCRREIPDFVQLQQKFSEQGVQFVGIALDHPLVIDEFLLALGVELNYPNLIAEKEAIEVAKSYGNALGVLPYSVLIDRDGRIAHIQYGEMSKDFALSLLQKLL